MMIVLGQGGVSTGILHSSLCLQCASPDPARTPCSEHKAWYSMVCTLDPSSSLLSPHRSVVMAIFLKPQLYVPQCLIYPFQVCSSVVFSMFTEFCRYQNSLILDPFITPKRKLIASSTHPCSPQSEAAARLLALSIDF